jgi:hypothetical protein
MKIAEEIHISAEQDTAAQRYNVKFPLEKKRYAVHVLQAD